MSSFYCFFRFHTCGLMIFFLLYVCCVVALTIDPLARLNITLSRWPPHFEKPHILAHFNSNAPILSLPEDGIPKSKELCIQIHLPTLMNRTSRSSLHIDNFRSPCSHMAFYGTLLKLGYYRLCNVPDGTDGESIDVVDEFTAGVIS